MRHEQETKPVLAKKASSRDRTPEVTEARCRYAAQLINGPRSKPSAPIEIVTEALEIMDYGNITVAEMLKHIRSVPSVK